MKSVQMNKEVSFTPEERDELVEGLIKAGIDKKDISNILGKRFEGGNFGRKSRDEDCRHRFDGCDLYDTNCTQNFSVNASGIDKLLQLMKEHNISPKALGKAAKKLTK